MARTSAVPAARRGRSKAAAAELRDATALEGVLPAHQDRSRASQAALIDAGIRMLESRDYKSLSIAELTAANGLSIGAFYARFSGKDAFLGAVQRKVFEDVRSHADAFLAPERWSARPAKDVLGGFVDFFIDLVRRHRGLIHAALQHEATHPSAWTPLRKVGGAMSAKLADVLAPKLTHLSASVRYARVGFAVQMLYGTLINAVLHDPGPLALADDRIADELLRALSAYLGIAESTSAPRKRRHKSRERTRIIA